MTSVTDVRGDLKPESTGWLFKSPLAGGGASLVAPPTYYRPHNNIFDVAYCNLRRI